MPTTFPYPTEVETAMRVMYRSLRENDRRRYAAVEAAKLGADVLFTAQLVETLALAAHGGKAKAPFFLQRARIAGRRCG